MYKALITDLDGTAVAISSQGEDVDTETKKTIQNALKRGKKIACATGREWDIAKRVIQELGFTSPCIIEGGTRIVDPRTGETLWEKSLPPAISSNILDIFKSNSTVGMLMHSHHTAHRPLSDVGHVPSSLRFIYLLAVPELIAATISEAINAQQGIAGHLTPSWTGKGFVDIHVTHQLATKEHAILAWQKLEQVESAETIGLGDSNNDLPLFLSSGLKIAVGNATANLKDQADYIAPPVGERALKHVIDKFMCD